MSSASSHTSGAFYAWHFTVLWLGLQLEVTSPRCCDSKRLTGRAGADGEAACSARGSWALLPPATPRHYFSNCILAFVPNLLLSLLKGASVHLFHRAWAQGLPHLHRFCLALPHVPAVVCVSWCLSDKTQKEIRTCSMSCFALSKEC